jgi:hypothetical protein
MSGYDIPAERWALLGKTAPSSLADGRLQLHQAVQTIASFGQALIEAKEDDSHRNMNWDYHAVGFRSWPTADGRTVLVRADPFEIVLEGGGVRRSLPLADQTLEGAYRWLERALSLEPGTLAPPEFEIPAHAVGGGAPFDPDPTALGELARWYSNAGLALEAVASTEIGASAVRCWPHHFDIATLITLEGEGPDGGKRTVGCGLSPGDGSYPDPYWYVTPWPYDWDADRPPLPGGGRWHAEGWLGAVLTADQQVGHGSARDQASMVGAFLSRAVEACKHIAPQR